MKKLLIALAAAGGLSLAGQAQADPEKVINSTSFEGIAAGTTVNTGTRDASGDEGNGYFYYTNATASAENGTKVLAYDSSVTASAKQHFMTNSPNSNYLSLSTEGGTLYRSFNTQTGSGVGTPVAIGEDGIYIDTLVQFTVCEDEPTLGDADAKLAIWIGVETNASGNVTGTNLYVKAGSWTAGGVDPAVYTLSGAGFNAANVGDWYRLTVSAYGDIADGSAVMPAFSIAIDGVELAASANPIDSAKLSDVLPSYATAAGASKLFPSLLGSSATSLAAVGFQGTGYVDEFVVTTENPFYVAPTSVDFTLAWGANVSAIQFTIGSGAQETILANGSAGSSNITIAIEGGVAPTVTLGTISYAAGYMEAAEEVTSVNMTAGANGLYTVTQIATAPVEASLTISAGASIAVKIGDTNYRSLADALVALSNGDTLTLQGNASTDGIDLTGKTGVTFDLNSNTLTYAGEEYAITIADGATATISNGVISAANGGGILVSVADQDTVGLTVGDLTVTAGALEAIAVAADGTPTTGTSASLAISSGSFEGNASYGSVVVDEGSAAFTHAAVSGGRFKQDIDDSLLVAGKETVAGTGADEGWYVVQDAITTVDFTLALGSGVSAVSYTINGGESIAVVFDNGSATITGLNIDETVVFTLTPAAGIVRPSYTVNGSATSSGGATHSVTVAEAGSYTFGATDLFTGVDFTIALGSGISAVTYTIDGVTSEAQNANFTIDDVAIGKTVTFALTSSATYPAYSVDGGTPFYTGSYEYTVTGEEAGDAKAITFSAVDASAAATEEVALEALTAGLTPAQAEATSNAVKSVSGATTAQVIGYLEAKTITAAAVAANPDYLEQSYDLDQATLFTAQPTAKVTSIVNSGTTVTVEFEIDNGSAGSAVTIDATKASVKAYVESLFEGSTDLSTWNVELNVAVTEESDTTLTATVTPVSSSYSNNVYIRLRK